MTCKLLCSTGVEVRALRESLGMNQSDFWKTIHVTQSGGSRYEAGRSIPKQVLMLLHLRFAEEKKAAEFLADLRSNKVTELPPSTRRRSTSKKPEK